jgi:putative ABC transport system substrate-binding protein
VKRREFIAALAGAGAWPSTGHPQQTMPVVGVLIAVSPQGFAERVRRFREGLLDSGYVEGQNLLIEYRWAENRPERLPELAADLVSRKVSVIAALGGPGSAIAAKAATNSIPIVFGIPDDPVKLGLVASLARPGGNLTGVNFLAGELMGKRLEFMRLLVPGASSVAVFVNPGNPARADAAVNEIEHVGRAMGLRVVIHHTGTTREIVDAFATLSRERTDLIFIAPDPFFVGHRVQLAELAAHAAIPASYSVRDHTEAGGLMSYGANINDGYRRAGVYTGRVLKGEKPADLPIELPTKFELVINLKTAKALRLTVPNAMQMLADELIE